MLITKIHTPETLVAHILALPDQTELLINAVDCNYVGPFGRKPSVSDIMLNAVYEIEAEGGTAPTSEVLDATWGLLDDAADALLEARDGEKSAYEASLLWRQEYSSERLGRSQMV